MNNRSSVKRFSLWIHRALSASFVMTPVYYIFYWFLVGHDTRSFVLDTSNPAAVGSYELPLQLQMAGFFSSLFPMIILMCVLFYLRKIFSSYKEGIIFSFEHVVLFKKIAKYLAIWVLLTVIYETVKSVLFSLGNPVGERMLTVTFGSEEITVILVSVFIYVIAWVMNEGRVLAEENQMTI
ncbi:DUF2975 domain-containing protein [Pseudomonas sp. HK3]|jgi:hypothetical protein